MRVPKVQHYSGKTANVSHVHLDKPIIIPRLPVITTEKQKYKLILLKFLKITNLLDFLFMRIQPTMSLEQLI